MTFLQLNNLTIFTPQHLICRDFTLSVTKGSVVGVLGPNGCGKTTFLQTIAGLHPFTAGNILFGEQPLNQLPIKTLAQIRGILFQDFHASFPQTVWEYCLASRYPHSPHIKKETLQIVMRALDTMELTSFKHRLITELSGGEKKRLAIAALLAQTPDIYLLDEPVNHLDMRHQIQILTHFNHLAKTRSAVVMMSLHDINLAQQFCDYLLLLFPQGEIKCGPAAKMLTVDNLTRLYQHPMQFIISNKISFWYAEPLDAKLFANLNII